MKTRAKESEVQYETYLAILFVFLLLLSWPNDAAVEIRRGDVSKQCHAPAMEDGLYPSGVPP